MGAIKKTTNQPKTVTPDVADGDEDAKKSPAMRPDEMSAEVLEFINALDAYKRTHQRPFPNGSEIFEVLRALGYSRSAR